MCISIDFKDLKPEKQAEFKLEKRGAFAYIDWDKVELANVYLIDDNGEGVSCIRVADKDESLYKSRWLEDSERSGHYYCENCGWTGEHDFEGAYRYCPGCGLRMEIERAKPEKTENTIEASYHCLVDDLQPF